MGFIENYVEMQFGMPDLQLILQFMMIFREYINNTLSEEQLIDSVEPLNNEISKWFLNKAIYQYLLKSCTIGRKYLQNLLAQYMIKYYLSATAVY